MIDIENKVIDTMAAAFSGIAEVSGTYVETPETFPWVYIRQDSNSTMRKYTDNSVREHAVSVSFTVEVYSDLKAGAKQEVKNLLQIADECMQGMKFVRTSSNIIPNYDRTVTRGYSNYSVNVWEPKQVGDNTVYQMFRR